MSRQALQQMRRPDETAEHKPLEFPHMQSESYKRIHYELLRYCRGEIDGISVLIAGQRGAGKTTLTKLIIQSAMQDSEGLIPLPLVLHGPTIIDRGTVTNDDSDATPQGDPQEKQRALHQIITALYRSLSTAIYDAWLTAAEEAPNARRAQEELLALRAHLDLRLERAPPDPDVLRKIWSRAGFLRSGVAFYLRPVREMDDGALTRDSGNIPRIAGNADDQGLREIVALSACADAYRVILGKLDEVLKREQQRDQAVEESLSPPRAAESKKSGEEAKIKSTGEKLAPLSLGAAAGVATTFVVKDGVDGYSILGLFTGLAVWAASWAAMSYGVRRSREETRREMTLVIKWDIDRLERDLPVLLKRVKDAGFAPIFVLDELDKAEDAADALDGFLRLAKHIVTDQAAFLFLTNRDYYEQLVQSEYVDMGHAP